MKGNWTKKKAIDEAKNYRSMGVLKKRNRPCYDFIVASGYTELVTLMMANKTKSGVRNIEAAVEEAKKYTKRTDLKTASRWAYNKLCRSGKLDEACAHMGGKPDEIDEHPVQKAGDDEAVSQDVSVTKPVEHSGGNGLDKNKPMSIEQWSDSNMCLPPLMAKAGHEPLNIPLPCLNTAAAEEDKTDVVVDEKYADIIKHIGKYKSVYNFKKADPRYYNRCRLAGVLDTVKGIIRYRQRGVAVPENDLKRVHEALDRFASQTDTAVQKIAILESQKKVVETNVYDSIEDINMTVIPEPTEPKVNLNVVSGFFKPPGLSAGAKALYEILQELEARYPGTEYTIAYIPGVNWGFTIEGKGSATVSITRTAFEETRTITSVRTF